MSAQFTPPKSEPTQVYQGDDWLALVSLQDFPATDWSLRYTLGGPQDIQIAATASGGDHLLKVNTSTWAAGNYNWRSYVISSTGTHTIAVGQLDVLDFASASVYEQTLAAINQAILDRMSGDTPQAYTLEGQNIQNMTIDQLMKAHDKYMRICQAERDLRSGQGAIRQVIFSM